MKKAIEVIGISPAFSIVCARILPLEVLVAIIGIEDRNLNSLFGLK